MPTAIWTSSRALSMQNTVRAEESLIAANTATEQSGTINRRRVGDWTLDPLMDPIGDGLWVLMAAALSYAAIILIRRKHQKV